jgi:hypothetical protein
VFATFNLSHLLILGCAVATAGAWIIWAVSNVWGILLGVVFFGFGTAFQWPGLFSLISVRAGRLARPIVALALMVALLGAGCIGCPLIGYIQDHSLSNALHLNSGQSPDGLSTPLPTTFYFLSQINAVVGWDLIAAQHPNQSAATGAAAILQKPLLDATRLVFLLQALLGNLLTLGSVALFLTGPKTVRLSQPSATTNLQESGLRW